MALHHAPVLLPSPAPEPAYAEYDDVRAEAHRRGTGFVTMRDINAMQGVVRSRGVDWCTTVPGGNFPGIAYVPRIGAWMLVIADERGLAPPLPKRVVDARRKADEHRTHIERKRIEADQRGRREWVLLVSPCPIQVVVHTNLKHGGHGELLHTVPVEPVRSKRGTPLGGPGARSGGTAAPSEKQSTTAWPPAEAE